VLPDVSQLRLEEIQVQAPRPEPPSEAALLERLAARTREAARYAPKEGAVEAGDELVVDLVLSTSEGLLPGGVLEGARLWRAHPTLGAVHAALEGVEVGASFEREVLMGDAHWTLAGQVVHARGRVRAAFFVDAPELKGDMHDVMRDVADELREEAEADAAGQARELVFDALLERVDVEVDRAWVDAGLEASFDARERELLEALAPERLEEARALWLGEGLARDMEERKVKVTLILRALCERDRVVLTKEAVGFAVERVAVMMGVEPGEVAELVKREPEVDHQVTNLAMQMVAIHHVLSRVKVKDPPKRFSVLGARMTTLMD
jgi:trigger factor